MYLSLSNILAAPFRKTPATESRVNIVDEVDYTYIKGNIESRGPCPGLNALANHGYIARDGKNITVAQVDAALKTALHMSPLAAKSLTGALKGLLRKDGTFDLVDTRRHNVIEHDSSFTRLDFHQGDNYTFQPQMLEDMIKDANGGDVTLRSMAKTFIRRGKESREAGAPKLPLNLWFVRVLQYVGLINSAQTGGKLNREILEAVFVEERFPDVILDNPKPRTVLTLLSNALGMMYWVVVGP
ncbi:uncharacterized protein N0V89_000258 [Didymosphaeria variabile]|uniref:Heme haloperoxidase family profile domain-containing protein n=1 Tax=Didymosphaeria variabile TaxID=1932322 RepID=A0A9W9CFJ6_9PLEO|nr:uncharacterized protein N0V89_000258 [Didymosphaeria variabile]KAJ4359702.1 hypothetical protein N0V89_000258 [Didymosphaeria variabile]